jgi:hypothetical protein
VSALAGAGLPEAARSPDESKMAASNIGKTIRNEAVIP